MLTDKAHKKFWAAQKAFVEQHTDYGRSITVDYPGAAAHWYIKQFVGLRKDVDRLLNLTESQDREIRRLKSTQAQSCCEQKPESKPG